ncbi:MAG: LysR family transcriptional regulator [Oceanospirillaceae bacterium]|nr:LysR family transcriptional regulator [Oceanospirillaceae bacterium]
MNSKDGFKGLQDWNLVRAFIFVAEQGSLSAAARKMNISQPTLGRQIQQLEKSTGLNLFRRSTQGLEITAEGRELMSSAKQAMAGMEAFQRQVVGHSDQLVGDIRISVNEIFGVYMMPRVIAEFQCLHPQVQIEMVITNQTSSLSKRDADLALRMFKPTQPNLVARRLPDLQLGFFAHNRYLKKNGTPQSPKDFISHKIIGFDLGNQFLEGAEKMGWSMTAKHFSVRTDSLIAHLALLRAAAGIVSTHVGLIRNEPEITQIMHDIKIPDLELWVVCHQDVQFNRRIKTFMDFLITAFADDPYSYMEGY